MSRTASIEEIRQAYRQLARLMHPDQQPDGALRRLAEIQMKRLHMVVAVLSDAERRRSYDCSLLPAAETRAERLRAWVRCVPPSSWVWAAASVVVVCTIGTFFSSNAGGSRMGARTGENRPAAAPVVRAATSAPGQIQPAARSQAAAPRRLALPEMRTDAAEELPPGPEMAVAIAAELPPMADARVDPPAPRTVAAFGGNWIYSPSAEVGRRRSVYVPEFIELKILEKDGQLRGEYRARYLVTDRAISPAVVFHFEGRASPPRSTLPWKGAGGAYGRVTLRMADENSLEVTWTATKLSEDLGLISGTATLMRGREP